ncbi:MAG TPA: FtsX-like permease family protein [Chitinophagaceae bacterium]
MIRNYIKIAWRNLIRSKGYTVINIGGLAVGMTVAILIGLWIHDELSFNKYHQNYDRIAQIMIKGNFNGQRYSSSSIARPLEFELRNKYAGPFRHIVMSRWDEEHILSFGDKTISQVGRFMQEGAPAMLSLEMKKGGWNGLKDPHSIMLSSSAAKALFGDEDPMNKMMRIDNQMEVRITGVYEDLPYNSNFKNLKFLSSWDLLMSYNKWMQDAKDQWGNSSFLMYVQLQPNTTFDGVSTMVSKAAYNQVDEEDKKFNPEVFLNPLSRWHLYSEWKDGVNTGGRIQYVWMFGIIGAFVLFLACINFMNLSTARSEKRAKEVGIRKAIGSVRGQLVKQFLFESFLVVLLSFGLSIIFASLSLPWFNSISDKQMVMPWTNKLFWMISMFFIVITSFVSGSYPAFYLSSFSPVKVLKGTFNVGRFASMPRKVLVVLQFSVSVILIIGTIIVYQQIQHAKDRPVGYSRNGLLTMHIKSPDLLQQYDVLSAELENQGIVTEISRSSSPTTAVWSKNSGLEWKDKDPNKVGAFGTIWITHDYGKTVGWKMKEGRDYSTAFATDSVSSASDSTVVYNMIVNEAAVRYMELKNPIGEIIRWSGFTFKIVGVVKDMLMESPFDPVRQTMYLVNYEEATSCIHLRINPNLTVSKALGKMGDIVKRVVPTVPFDYKFVDTEYGLKFAAEERVGRLASVFAVLAIFISCLGLFGLASFVAERRTREIGIRKVLGATVYNLWKMLSNEFVVLVIVSCVIATPLAYYFLNQWLQKYEYRTDISWWIFAIGIGGALLITLLTVSFQAIKAAIANPVRSLRTE